jgi:glycosyltransferase involved in cell wall biosynthesis
VDVSIACPSPSPLASKALEAGLGLIEIPKRGLVDFAAAGKLRRLLDEGRLDIVHSHNGRTALAAALAASRSKRGKCVATQHFIQPDHATKRGLKAMVFNWAHHWVNARTAAFIAISEATRDGILARHEAPAERITVVPNGIPDPDVSKLRSPEEVRRELGISESAPLVVCAARLQPEKDVASLIAAMKAVTAEIPGAVCAIAGEGALHADLQSQIDRMGLQTSVRLLGFRADVMSIMRAGDVFVLPSLAEPFGLVLLEAMSLGRAAVATAAGGPLEIVSAGETGLLVPPATPAALASAMIELLRDRDRARAMGTAGRRRFEEKFTAERMAQATAGVYRKALNLPRESAARAESTGPAEVHAGS